MPKIVDKVAIRTDIMDAALNMYAENGYHATSMSMIAQAADMAKGKLYIYFKSKEELTQALVKRHLDYLESRILGGKTSNTLDDLIKGLQLSMEVPANKVTYIKVYSEVFGPSFSSAEFAGQVTGFYDRIGNYYAQQIMALQANGQISQRHNASSLGRAMASMLDGMILHHGLFNISPHSHKQMVADVLDVLKIGLNT